MDKLIAIGLILVNTFLASIGMLFLKKGATNFGKRRNIMDFVRFIFSRYIIGGAIFYFLGTVVFIWVLTQEDLSYLYPLTAMAYFWIILFSVKFLKEKMNKYKWLGVLLIILGVVITSV